MNSFFHVRDWFWYSVSPRSVRFGTDSSQVINLLHSMNLFYFRPGPRSCSAVEPVLGGERHHPVGPEGRQGPGQVPGDFTFWRPFVLAYVWPYFTKLKICQIYFNDLAGELQEARELCERPGDTICYLATLRWQGGSWKVSWSHIISHLTNFRYYSYLVREDI